MPSRTGTRARKASCCGRRFSSCHRAARLVKGTLAARRGRKATGPSRTGSAGLPRPDFRTGRPRKGSKSSCAAHPHRPGRTAMLARIRKAQEEREGGFTLIELLVVMIIIGILAAIAIPVFLNQRKKAQDSAAKADVSTLGKEVATYYVDGTGSTATGGMAITNVAGRYVLNVTAVPASGVDAVTNQDLGKASANVDLKSQQFNDGTHWCVSVANEQGDKAKTSGTTGGYKYSAKD